MPQIDLTTGMLWVEGLPAPIMPRMEHVALEALLGDRLGAVPTHYPMRTQRSLHTWLGDKNKHFQARLLLILDELRSITLWVPKESLTTLEGRQWFLTTSPDYQQKYVWGVVSFHPQWPLSKPRLHLSEVSSFAISYFQRQHTP